MILNIIGKNYQQMREYVEAEKFLIRSTHLLPGRIYPYYLLAKLYAEPEFYHSDKLRQSVEIVLTKEPKVQSTAVKQMREEARKLLCNHWEILNFNILNKNGITMKNIYYCFVRFFKCDVNVTMFFLLFKD